MKKIPDSILSKLINQFERSTREDREKLMGEIERKYPPEAIKNIRDHLEKQFSKFDKQSNKLSDVENVFHGKASHGVDSSAVDKLIKDTQESIADNLLKKLPAVPTHKIEEKSVKAESTRRSAPVIKKIDKPASSSQTKSQTQQQNFNSRVKDKLPNNMSEVVANARQKAKEAVNNAKIQVSRYRQNKTPFNKREAIAAIKKARQYLQHANQMNRQLQRITQVNKNIKQVKQFKSFMDKLHTPKSQKGKANYKGPGRKGP
ncbi:MULTISPECIES: hypothetical protein [unclassified Legionella]|uniref:hypothetical protein n=1 Tax=unclassified Legionella TaxID=2622702 RepID=UPI001054BF02|nr:MULTISPECIES: hypothetical protein [unclassified Legionella]MDI9819164.1 hypothetical protein [Legionella sp. PL877]